MHPYNIETQEQARRRARQLQRLRDAGYTLEEIGQSQKPPISRERVRQILNGRKREGM